MDQCGEWAMKWGVQWTQPAPFPKVKKTLFFFKGNRVLCHYAGQILQPTCCLQGQLSPSQPKAWSWFCVFPPQSLPTSRLSCWIFPALHVVQKIKTHVCTGRVGVLSWISSGNSEWCNGHGPSGRKWEKVLTSHPCQHLQTINRNIGGEK